MNDGTREVRQGTQDIASAGDAFNHIINSFSLVNQQIQEMSAASQEMAASAETDLQSIVQKKTRDEKSDDDKKNVKLVADDQMAELQEVTSISSKNDRNS